MSIEVSQLTRFFGQAPAVHQLDMSVPSGAVTGLVGPNGAGKTTLLLMLAAFTLSAVVLLMEMSHKKFQKIKISF